MHISYESLVIGINDTSNEIEFVAGAQEASINVPTSSITLKSNYSGAWTYETGETQESSDSITLDIAKDTDNTVTFNAKSNGAIIGTRTIILTYKALTIKMNDNAINFNEEHEAEVNVTSNVIELSANYDNVVWEKFSDSTSATLYMNDGTATYDDTGCEKIKIEMSQPGSITIRVNLYGSVKTINITYFNSIKISEANIKDFTNEFKILTTDYDVKWELSEDNATMYMFKDTINRYNHCIPYNGSFCKKILIDLRQTSDSVVYVTASFEVLSTTREINKPTTTSIRYAIKNGDNEIGELLLYDYDSIELSSSDDRLSIVGNTLTYTNKILTSVKLYINNDYSKILTFDKGDIYLCITRFGPSQNGFALIYLEDSCVALFTSNCNN